MPNEVIVLKEGYIEELAGGRLRADATISLVKGEKNIIVDTGNPASGSAIVSALAKEGLAPGDIDIVVCTHAHTDHTGNNGLFPRATFTVGHDESTGDIFSVHDFGSGPVRLCQSVELLPTGGHTKYDVSLKVETGAGVVFIVGDLIFTRPGRKDDEIWKVFAEQPDEQVANRAMVISQADFIVPGHAGMFKVSELSQT